MKKIALTSLMAMLVATGANAAAGQWFVGGGASLSTAKETGTVYAITPEIGYSLTSRWDIGLDLGFAKSTNLLIVPGYETNQRDFTVAPFARYNLAQFGGLNVLVKGSVGADFINYSLDGDNEISTQLFAKVTPMLTYDISESFTLFAELNFLGMEARQQLKNDDLNIADTWTFSMFGDANNVATTKDFTIGFTYNF